MPKASAKLAAARIAVVAFDLNGTLIGWREAFDESFRESLQEWVGRWSGAEEDDLVGRAVQRYYQATSQWDKKSSKSITQRRLESMEYALKELPLPNREALASAILGQIRELQPQLAKLSNGAKETLEQLSGKYRIAVISDTRREAAVQAWEHSGLKEFVNEAHLFTPPAAGKRKPQPARFRAVTDAFRVPPSRCVMVGDSWKRDIEGAAKAGWHAVWLQTKKPASRQLPDGTPVVRIASLRALPRLLV